MQKLPENNLLFDTLGRACTFSQTGRSARERDPARDPAYAAVIDYAIEQLGHVFLHARREEVRVRVSARSAAPQALVALGYWLADRNPRRVVMFDRGAQPAAQLLFTQQQIRRHIGAL